MIVIKLQGGLGNQMFQYAFGLVLSTKLNTSLYLYSSFAGEEEADYTARSYELYVFSNNLNIANEKLINSFLRPSLLQRVFNKTGILKKTVYREKTLRYSEGAFNIKPPAYFEGFWQSEQHFNHNEEMIRKSLTFKKPLNSESQKIVESISQQQNTVSVHVRRGDYISSKTTNELHGICSIKYYKQAIELIKEKTPDSYFYFFSDDAEWVKENLLPVVERATLVQHNVGSGSWQDMALMSKCRNHIIANSSFSWWGAWLNPDKEKIVIAPESWFSSQTAYFDDKDIVPESWIRLPNE